MKKSILVVSVLALAVVPMALAASPQPPAKAPARVLMIVNEAQNAALELMLTKEVGVMKSMLEQAGYTVVVATGSGQVMTAGTATLKPDLKLGEVKLADYKGVIVPCMGVSAAPLPSEGMALLKDAAAKLPVAAQTGGVVLLARAGALDGKKFAMAKSWTNPELKAGINSGEGVVRDGNIITSGICPLSAARGQGADGTAKLTETFIAALKQ